MKTRIALISEHASPLAAIGRVDSGGQNVYVAHVARQLAAAGYLVDVFTRRDAPDLAPIVAWQPGVRVIHVPVGPPSFLRKEELMGLMPAFAEWMEGFIFRHNRHYALLHPNFWTSGMVAMQLKKRLQIPFVMTFHALGRVRRMHQGAADQFPEIREAVEKEIVDMADAVIAECPQDREDLVSLYQCDAAKITIIPCGVDSMELAPVDKAEARRHLGLPENERIVLQLGRMVPRKGVDLVIRGVSCLQKQHGLAARLVIVGGDLLGSGGDLDEIRRLQQIAKTENMADRVLFTGRRDRDVLRYFYSAADVFVTVPWYEPFGITPLEAMACGTPVVGADVGGIRYTVQHGRTGLLVPPRNFRSVANALAILFKDPALLHAYGQAGRQHVTENFNWRRVGADIAHLYTRLIKDVAAPFEQKGRLRKPGRPLGRLAEEATS